MNQIERAVARAIMENRDNGGCIVKDWEAEERDNPHVAQALRQARAAIVAMPPVPTEPVAWQRRARFTHPWEPAGTVNQWQSCSKAEATGHFERQPSYEYRPLYALPIPPAGGSDAE